MKTIFTIILAVTVLGAGKLAMAEPCAQFALFNKLSPRLTLQNVDAPAEAARLVLRKTSSDPQTIRYAVQVTAKTQYGYPLPRQMVLAVHNTQEIGGGCRGGFELNGELAFFAKGRLGIGTRGLRYDVYNPNACAGYFCTGKSTNYVLK